MDAIKNAPQPSPDDRQSDERGVRLCECGHAYDPEVGRLLPVRRPYLPGESIPF